jgi:hypothetical protein
MITNKIEAAQVRATAGYRPLGKPAVLGACKNCTHLRYDGEDRQGSKGVYFTKSHIRCAALQVQVNLTCVCLRHEFKHTDRRDV